MDTEGHNGTQRDAMGHGDAEGHNGTQRDMDTEMQWDMMACNGMQWDAMDTGGQGDTGMQWDTGT